MTIKTERRYFTCADLVIEQRAADGSTTVPVIRGHAAVFNQLSEDLGGWREQIAPGAFAEAIKVDDVRALWNHNADIVLGRNRAGTLTLQEDVRGLLVEITPPDTQQARDLVVSIQRGDVNQMSFGFSVRPNGQNWGQDDTGNYVRTLTNVRLFDVSPVTYPAYPQTDVAVDELRALRDSQAGTALQQEQRRLVEHRRRMLDLT